MSGVVSLSCTHKKNTSQIDPNKAQCAFLIHVILKFYVCVSHSLALTLQRLLARCANHDHRNERADERAADENENDGNPDGPFARGKQIVQWMSLIDEGHDKHPGGVVGKYGCSQKQH